MTELRKQFEVLPEIEILLNRSNIFFSEDDMNYFTYNYDDQSLVDEHCIKLAWYAFQEQQKQLSDAQRKYDALYNAFTVTDDARKEWHRCYMGVRQREDELQENIDQINQRAIDQAAHLQRVQEHNAKLQKRLKENGIPWQDLI